ncbi:MAG TPA: DUF2959 family protein [Burkholderiales bacterium]
MWRYLHIAAALIGALAVSCSTTAPERQEATASSLVELRDTVASARGQLETTLGALIALMHASPNKVQQAYNNYSTNVSAMTQYASRLEQGSRDVDRLGSNWLDSWRRSQQQVTDPELRQITQQRQQEVSTRLDNIEHSLLAARQSFGPFVRNLQDIQKVVGNDLTPHGLAAVGQSDVAQNATENGRAVGMALDTALSDLEAVIQAIAPQQARR